MKGLKILKTALLSNGKMINAWEYDVDVHGPDLKCIDSQCNVTVHYVAKSDAVAAHFKTSGKTESKHKQSCGFAKPLDPISSLKKVKQYQQVISEEEHKDFTIRLNMSRIDPDYESNTAEREKKENKNKNEVKVKNDNKTPQSISSVKSVIKLLTDYEPDILSQIKINVGKNIKLPLSDVIIDQIQAQENAWIDEPPLHSFFVYGRVERFVRLQKVMYISFETINDVSFTIVLFEKHWKYFELTEKDLIGKKVLVYGILRKNDYNDKKQTQIVIKSDDYIGFIKDEE